MVESGASRLEDGDWGMGGKESGSWTAKKLVQEELLIRKKEKGGGTKRVLLTEDEIPHL